MVINTVFTWSMNCIDTISSGILKQLLMSAVKTYSIIVSVQRLNTQLFAFEFQYDVYLSCKWCIIKACYIWTESRNAFKHKAQFGSGFVLASEKYLWYA